MSMNQPFREGQTLKGERQRRLLSQEELAERIGVSTRTIRRWENGKHIPQYSLQRQLCEFFQLSPEQLGFLGAGKSSELENIPLPVEKSNTSETKQEGDVSTEAQTTPNGTQGLFKVVRRIFG